MRQVLFEIPGLHIPVFGFGVMLVLAFAVSAWVGGRRVKAQGHNPTILWDVGLYVFIAGIVGARITSMFVDQQLPDDVWQVILQFLRIWEGGLVLYGSIPGGIIGYLLAYRYVVKPNNVRTLQIGDWLAPAIALGIAFGRLGCFLNGCCYGDVADPARVPAWLSNQFPANSHPYNEVVWYQGWQSTYGFTLDDWFTIKHVDRGSSADQAGLKPGDRVLAVNDKTVKTKSELDRQLQATRSYQPLNLVIDRNGQHIELTFVPPPSLPLLPTQLLMTLDALLLFGLMWAYYPFRRREGAVLALLMMTYAVNRYLIEQLRLDNPEFLGPLTVSQAISIALFTAGAVMMVLVQKYGRPV
jgi:phosphatidylglycerol:prolipoprotein diacylglycerol transferase